jgi:hypothetical protein
MRTDAPSRSALLHIDTLKIFFSHNDQRLGVKQLLV